MRSARDTLEWFPGWIDAHQRLNPHHRWVLWGTPEAMEFYRGWIEAFQRHGVTLAKADAASRAIQANPPHWPEQHLKIILEIVDASARSHGVPPRSREELEKISRDCPHCSGTGQATVWIRPGIEPAPRMKTTVALCTCPIGRWLVDHHRQTDPGTLRRFQDFAAIQDGSHERWLPFPPELPPAMDVDVEGMQARRNGVAHFINRKTDRF